MTKEKLNGLSIDALYALAEKIGLKLPMGLEPVIVVSELIEAFNEDSLDRRMPGDTAVHIEEKKFSGSELDEIDASLDVAACIECRYNDTRLHVLVRDPGWAFVFWDIRDEDYERIQSDPGNSSLFLRVVENPHSPASIQFDVSVSRSDSSWYIHLPQQNTLYSIELCAKTGSRVISLASAKMIRTPHAFTNELRSSMDAFTLEMALLSGLNSLDPPSEVLDHSTRIMDEYN